jgi:mannose-6-phosphate isomerase-like protein (cupin superfamily)
MRGKSLFDFPIHLGRGARAVEEPQFTGPEWYEAYGERHADDMDEGRIVSLFRFEEPWTSWEMHPAGDEVVCCLQGQMTLHQDLPDGKKQSHELGPGEYAINPAGVWHTADADRPVVALFITAGKDTTHRPRNPPRNGDGDHP